MLDMPPAPERCRHRLLSVLNPCETPRVIAVFASPDSGPGSSSIWVDLGPERPVRGNILKRHGVSGTGVSCVEGLAVSVGPAFGIRSPRKATGRSEIVRHNLVPTLCHAPSIRVTASIAPTLGVADRSQRSYLMGMTDPVSSEEREIQRRRGRRTLVQKRAKTGASTGL